LFHGSSSQSSETILILFILLEKQEKRSKKKSRFKYFRGVERVGGNIPIFKSMLRSSPIINEKGTRSA